MSEELKEALKELKEKLIRQNQTLEDSLGISKEKEHDMKLEVYKCFLLYEGYSDCIKHISKKKYTKEELVYAGVLLERTREMHCLLHK